MRYQPTADHDEYLAASFALLKQLEGVESGAYYDSDGIVTIGIGFNIQDDANLRIVMNRMGFTEAEISDASATGYRHQITNAFAGNHGGLQTRLDTIMSDRATALGSGRTTFTLTLEEMKSIFEDDLRVQKENVIHNWSNAIDASSTDSLERVALFSLAYNQAPVNPLLGNA